MVSFKVSVTINNIILLGNMYYILYGLYHFLMNFPKCDLLSFGNHRKKIIEFELFLYSYLFIP
jgi:hypothetical protein